LEKSDETGSAKVVSGVKINWNIIPFSPTPPIDLLKKRFSLERALLRAGS
jgi:hypothetical protein